MSNELVTPEAPVYQCRHIFTDGHRCGSRALRHELFCYYHHQTRKPAQGPSQAPRLALAPDPNSPFALPLPEDRSAIQQSIGLILQRIALNQIDPRRAGLLLYALQIASCNLPKAHKNAQPVETVEEITLDDTHGPLAPQSELHRPQGEKSLETILLEQWAKDDELAANPNPYPEDNLLELQATAQGCPRFRRSPTAPTPGIQTTPNPIQLPNVTPVPRRTTTFSAASKARGQNSAAATCPQAGLAPSRQALPCLLEGLASGMCRTLQPPRRSSSSAVPPELEQSAPRDRPA